MSYLSSDDESSDDEQPPKSAVAALVILLCGDDTHRPKKPRISRKSLPKYPKTESAWARISKMRDDQTFVKLLGLDCPAFTKLLRPFAKLFTQFDTECQPLRRKKIKSSVRLTSRSMTADGCLALALMFLSSEAEVKLLGVLFGLQEQRALKYIKMGLFLLKKVRSRTCITCITLLNLSFCGTVFIC